MNSQYSFKLSTFEFQKEEQLSNLKIQFEKQLNNIFIKVFEEFDILELINENKFTEQIFLNQIHSLAREYKKLRTPNMKYDPK